MILCFVHIWFLMDFWFCDLLCILECLKFCIAAYFQVLCIYWFWLLYILWFTQYPQPLVLIVFYAKIKSIQSVFCQINECFCVSWIQLVINSPLYFGNHISCTSTPWSSLLSTTVCHYSPVPYSVLISVTNNFDHSFPSYLFFWQKQDNN